MELTFTDGVDTWGGKVSPDDFVYVTDQIRYPDGEVSTKDFSIKKVKVSRLTKDQKGRMLHQTRRDADLAIKRQVKAVNAKEYSMGYYESAGQRLDKMISLLEGYMKEGHCKMEMKHPEALEGMHEGKMIEAMCEAPS